jgi:hypothetical protein
MTARQQCSAAEIDLEGWHDDVIVDLALMEGLAGELERCLAPVDGSR